ncbi:MAG: septum site-determining protein MinD [Clostridia bacterium]|nr:septum site-determining protein MinD [Clostridia bacterium]
MARKIVISSGKGGVGKTTCCFFLGFFLANLGAKVVMVDVDIGLNNLDVVSGVDSKVMYDIVDIVDKKCRVRQALIRYEKNPLLYILPSAHSLNVGKVSADALKDIISELERSFDYILIDCPAGIGKEFYRAVYMASEALIITTPSLVAVRDANKVASLISGCGISEIGLVVNRVRNDMVAKHLMLKPAEIASSLELKLFGAIPESDEIVALSSVQGDLSKVNDKSIAEFKAIALKIHNGFREQKSKGTFALNFKRKGNV